MNSIRGNARQETGLVAQGTAQRFLNSLARSNLARLPNYLKAFGLATGFKTFIGLSMAGRDPARLLETNLGGRKVALRNTTSDRSIFFQVLVKQEYDTSSWTHQHARLSAAYEHCLRQGRVPVIIDAGANAGFSALWYSARFPMSRIFSIEPHPENLAVLRRNVAHLDNVTVIEGALWDRPEKLSIVNPQAGAGAFRVTENAVAEGAGALICYTVPELVARQPNGQLFIVKIDIEGGERELFRSSTEWMGDASLIVLELHDWLYPGQMTSAPFLRSISDSQPGWDVVFGGENMFAFRV